MKTQDASEDIQNMTRILRDAVNKHGVGLQIVKTMEEMGELIQALAKWVAGEEKEPVKVQEEIADVLIMLMQLEIIFDIPEIQETIQRKLNRLDESLKGYPTCPVCGKNPQDALLGMCQACFDSKHIKIRLSRN